MTYRNPSLREDLVELFFENLRVRIDPAVDPFISLQLRFREPLNVILRCHGDHSCGKR